VTESLVSLHSLLRWLILASAILALFFLFRARGRDGWDHGAYFWCQAYAWLLGIQSILGVLLWVMEDRWHGGNTFLSWLHPAVMLVAVGIAHGGLAHAYRQKDDPAKMNRTAMLVVVGTLLLIAFTIPWLAH
jgi:hypothetical protein